VVGAFGLMPSIGSSTELSDKDSSLTGTGIVKDLLLISKVLLGSWSESEYSITLGCGIRLTMGWSVSESVSLKRRGLRIGVDGLKSG